MRRIVILSVVLTGLLPLQALDADDAKKPVRAAKKAPVAQAQKPAVQAAARKQAALPDSADKQDTTAAEVGLVRADRLLVNRLHLGKDAIAKENFVDAIDYLQSLVDRPGDEAFYVDNEEKAVLRSIRFEAERLIGSMPSAGLQAYELKFGSKANPMLQAAIRDSDVAALDDIARRYFYTNAGYHAAYRVGTYHLDRGQPLAAALCFDRLRIHPAGAKRRNEMVALKTAMAWCLAGMPDRASRCLLELKQLSPDDLIRVAGRPIRLFERDDQAVNWLLALIGLPETRQPLSHDNWSMFRGNPSRMASVIGNGPASATVWTSLTCSWKVPPDDTPFGRGVVDVSRQLRNLSIDLQKQNLAAFPSVNPLVVNNLVVFRTVNNLKAFDLESGTLKWETPADDSLEKLRNGSVAALPGDRGSILDPLLSQRVLTNSTYGTLSANQDYVFAIEGLGYSHTSPAVYSRKTNQKAHPLATKSFNRLTACRIADGRPVWEVGGPPGESPNELADNFFLGPPLPLGNRVYCLAEHGGQIRLLVLDADRGELQWSLALQSVPAGVAQLEHRSQMGLSPSYVDGILVCPTGAGLVTAIDVATRSLIWSYRYRDPELDNPRNRARMLAMAARLAAQPGGKPIPQKLSGHWLDSQASIVGGRVVLTPHDSDDLHCLDLATGTLQWTQPRLNRRYVAGTFGGSLIVVGNQQIERLKLDDGSAVWRKPVELPLLSGRGFLSGSRCYVPLSTAEVANVDLETGKVASTKKLAGGIVAGNLVCSGNRIIAQGVTTIACFGQEADAK